MGQLRTDRLGLNRFRMEIWMKYKVWGCKRGIKFLLAARVRIKAKLSDSLLRSDPKTFYTQTESSDDAKKRGPEIERLGLLHIFLGPQRLNFIAIKLRREREKKKCQHHRARNRKKLLSISFSLSSYLVTIALKEEQKRALNANFPPVFSFCPC